MRLTFLILVLISFSACTNNAEQSKRAKTDSAGVLPAMDTTSGYIQKFSDSKLENRITTALMKLPFVKKTNAYIDSFTSHKNGISFILDSLNKQEVSVRAGYNGDQRFETYYYFFVDPKTLEIKILDAVSDKKLSVKEYIKTLH